MNKKQELLEKHFKKFKENKNRDTLKQIQVTEDGTFIFCSSFRAVRVKNVVEPGDEYFIPDGIEGKYPDVSRLIPNISNITARATLPVAELKKMVEAVSVALEVVTVIVEQDFITFEPSNTSSFDKIGKIFISAKYHYQQDISTHFKFNVNTKYLKEMFMLFSQLELKEVNVDFMSNIRPVLFKSDDVEYLISPVRLGD